MKNKKVIIYICSLVLICLEYSCIPISPISNAPAQAPIIQESDFNCWKTKQPDISPTVINRNLLLFSEYFTKDNWQTNLFSYDLSTEKLELETVFPDILVSPQISPDGRYILYGKYWSDSTNLYFFDRATKKHQELPNFTNFTEAYKQWSQDSQCIIIGLAERVWAYRVTDDSVQERDGKFNLNNAEFTTQIKESPDGKYTAQICEDLNKVCLYKSNGEAINHQALVWPDLGSKYLSVVHLFGWSADGKIMAFGFNRPGGIGGYVDTIRLTWLNESGIYKFEDIEKTIVSRVIWSPDGNGILILGDSRKFEFYDFSTGKNYSISPEGNYSSAVWLPLENQIVYVSEDYRSLYRIDIDGTNNKQIPVELGTDTKIQYFFLVLSHDR